MYTIVLHSCYFSYPLWLNIHRFYYRQRSASTSGANDSEFLILKFPELVCQEIHGKAMNEGLINVVFSPSSHIVPMNRVNHDNVISCFHKFMFFFDLFRCVLPVLYEITNCVYICISSLFESFNHFSAPFRLFIIWM